MNILKNAILALSIMAAPLSADDIILKDGKMIEWKSIVDLGESYEVETTNGKKMTVKKADIERIEVKDTGVPLLTGATFTFDKKAKLATVDLSRFCDLKKGQVFGTWTTANGALSCTTQSDRANVFQTQFEPPDEEYDLNVTLERTDRRGGIGVGLALPNEHQVLFIFDRMQSSYSGPVEVEGREFQGTGSVVKGAFLENGKPKSITFMVRKNALVVRADGKDFFLWTDADWARCSVPPEAAVSNKKAIFFAAWHSKFIISKMSVVVPMAAKK